MIRKTQKKPITFDIGSERFKSVKLGFIDGNELLLKYMPKLIKIFKILQANKKEISEVGDDEKGFLSLNLDEICNAVGKNTLKEISEDLFEKTYVDIDGNWELIDPQDFESNSEMYEVAEKVFNHNYPDFFKGDSDTQDHEVSPSQASQVSKQKKSEKKLGTPNSIAL